MKKLFNSLFFLFLSIIAQAQYGYCPDELLPRYDAKKRLWGFVNLMGHWEIEPFYTQVSPFAENKAIVRKGKYFGAIDCQGSVIVPYKYQAITTFSSNRAWFRENNLWGLIDHKGKVLISPRFEEILPIEYSEFAWTMKNNKWTLFNLETGRQVGASQFDIVRPLSDNTSMVKDANGMFGIVNHVNCRYMIEPKISNIKKVSRSLLLFKLDGRWGMFSNEGRILRNPDYDTVYMASQAHFILVKDSKYGLMDTRGVTILEPTYDEIGNYGDGLFPYRQGNQYGYINLIGKIYIAPEYEMALPFNHKQAIVAKNGNFGVIDMHRKIIVPFVYKSVRQHAYHPYYILTKHDNSEIIADRSGKEVSPVFKKVYADSGNIIRVATNEGIRFWNMKTFSFLPDSFSDAEHFLDGYAVIKKNGKKGLVDERGQIRIPANYLDIDYYWLTNLLVFKTQTTDGLGLITPEGKPILKNIFQQIHPAGSGILKVRTNDLFGLYKLDGSIVSEAVYDYISSRSTDTIAPEWPAIIIKDNMYGLLNIKGQEIVKPAYKNIFYSGERIYAAQHKKGYSLFDDRGNLLNKQVFDSVGKTTEGRIPVYKGKRWGFLNLSGQQVIDLKYEAVESFSGSYCIVKQKGKYGLINKSGQIRLAIMYDEWRDRNGELQFRLGEKWETANRLPVFSTAEELNN